MPSTVGRSSANRAIGRSQPDRSAPGPLGMVRILTGGLPRVKPRRIDSGHRPPHSEPTTPKGALMAKPTTIRELRDSGYTSRSVKQELRDNLIARLRRGEGLFSGIVGYEQTVVPQIENAVLSGQDIVFLGERGQAKTRMARLLVGLLD